MKLRLPLVTVLATAIASVSAMAMADFHDHLGMQMWSLRATTLAKGLPASLDLVKDWGIKEVEGGGSVGTMTPAQIRAALDERGLTSPSMHVGYEVLTKDVAAVIRDAKVVGATMVICPWIPHEGDFNAALAKKTIEDFNKWGAAFHAAGMKFGYHPHGYEFIPTTGDETLLDEIIRGTNPEYVTFEMDVFWAYHGGGDPVKLLEKYPTRWSALHVKDIRKGAPHGKPTGHAPDTDNVAVGSGQIDWKAVIGTAEKIGVKYYFIEDETPDPLKNIPLTLAYLKTLKP
jgi:sugar phosphate isomerase/epimerase